MAKSMNSKGGEINASYKSQLNVLDMQTRPGTHQQQTRPGQGVSATNKTTNISPVVGLKNANIDVL